MGCGLPGGEQGYNIGRVVAVQLGYDFLPGTTVTRYCSSSLQTTRMAAHAIRAGEGDVFISRRRRDGQPLRQGQQRLAARHDEPALRRGAGAHRRDAADRGLDGWHDPREDGQVPDVYIAMGQTAENLARLKGVTRQEMDEFAARSQNNAEKAIADGFFEREITPVHAAGRHHVTKDDGPRAGVTVEGMAGLKPVFRPDGRVTAGNACPLNDGASAIVIMSDTKADELGLTPLARIVSTSVTGLSPEIMGYGPVDAIRLALKRAGKTVDDIDVFEINEAFAAQVIPSYRDLGIPLDKLNLFGGAIAVGHPFGSTGARITGTLHQRPADARQAVRRRDHVRRRRHGHGHGAGAPELVPRTLPTAGPLAGAGRRRLQARRAGPVEQRRASGSPSRATSPRGTCPRAARRGAAAGARRRRASGAAGAHQVVGGDRQLVGQRQVAVEPRQPDRAPPPRRRRAPAPGGARRRPGCRTAATAAAQRAGVNSRSRPTSEAASRASRRAHAAVASHRCTRRRLSSSAARQQPCRAAPPRPRRAARPRGPRRRRPRTTVCAGLPQPLGQPGLVGRQQRAAVREPLDEREPDLLLPAVHPPRRQHHDGGAAQRVVHLLPVRAHDDVDVRPGPAPSRAPSRCAAPSPAAAAASRSGRPRPTPAAAGRSPCAR